MRGRLLLLHSQLDRLINGDVEELYMLGCVVCLEYGAPYEGLTAGDRLCVHDHLSLIGLLPLLGLR